MSRDGPHTLGGSGLTDTERTTSTIVAPTEPPPRTVRSTIDYRVRRGDLARRLYWYLGKSKRKPEILATARLLRLCELCAMLAMPGVTLGGKVEIEHLAGTERGTLITVNGTAIEPSDHRWEWHVTVRDTHRVLARCVLGFKGDIDRRRYDRQLAPERAARTIATTVRLLALDALSLLPVAALPVQIVAVWQGWVSMVATETVLVIGWAISLKTGIPNAVTDWLTIRQRKRQ